MNILFLKILSFNIVILSLVSTAHAAERSINFAYKGYTAGLLAARIDGTLDTTNQRFYVSLRAGDAGISSVVNWGSQIDGTGVLVPEGVAPERFNLQSRRRAKFESRSISYKGGIATVSFSRDPGIASNEIIDPSQTSGTLDPAAAFMAVLNNVDHTGSCNISLPVFDSKSLYTFKVRSAGYTNVSDRNAAYKGRALRCRITPVPVAGKAMRPDNRAKMTSVDMWIAKPIASGPMIPVKMTANVQGVPLNLVLTSIN